MESQIILLQEIKSALWVLICLVGVGVLFNIVRAVAASYKTIKSELANAFYNSATSFFEACKYEALIEYCHEHIKKKPDEAYAYWFLGKAYFQRKLIRLLTLVLTQRHADVVRSRAIRNELIPFRGTQATRKVVSMQHQLPLFRQANHRLVKLWFFQVGDTTQFTRGD